MKRVIIWHRKMAVTRSSRYHHVPITDWDQYYKDTLDNASHYNTRLTIERKLRLPFLDSHTGVAQNNCYIWMQKRHRGPGEAYGQFYTYPSRRWRKKRGRPPPIPSSPQVKPEEETDAGMIQNSDLNLIGSVENALGVNSEEANSLIESILNTSEKDSKEDSLMKDLDTLSDIPDAGEIEDIDSMRSDDEDYEYTLKKKKSSKKTKTSRRKADADMPTLMAEDKEKPFACNLCGRRYKNRPGLTYHVTHSHGGIEVAFEEKSQPSPLEPAVQTGMTMIAQNLVPPPTTTSTPANSSGIAAPNNYCDFCLGDASENKKTGVSEELISCSDCGRSGHPSCLQFTTKMTSNVKKYRWQCIECKSCHLCGTSDNDDQLLFCDDCDRGYHMYCLNPPMSHPPEGSWICNLCEQDLIEEKKQQQQQQPQTQHLPPPPHLQQHHPQLMQQQHLPQHPQHGHHQQLQQQLQHQHHQQQQQQQHHQQQHHLQPHIQLPVLPPQLHPMRN